MILKIVKGIIKAYVSIVLKYHDNTVLVNL